MISQSVALGSPVVNEGLKRKNLTTEAQRHRGKTLFLTSLCLCASVVSMSFQLSKVVPKTRSITKDYPMSQEKESESSTSKSQFEAASEEQQLSLFQEFRIFIVENKAWWMIPILLVLSFVGVLLVLASTGAAPFIYTLF